MSGEYYARAQTTHLDGSPIFKSQDDEAAEQEVAAIIEKAWRCKLRSFGCLSVIDWYAERQGRLVGLLELKHRSHLAGKYPTVFLNVRKWLALSLGSVGLGVPALFVVQFQDGLKYITLQNIDGSHNRVAGCLTIVKSRNDIEPVIEIAVSAMVANLP